MDNTQKPLVQVDGLKMYFPIYKGLMRRKVGDVKAVDGISFDIFSYNMKLSQQQEDAYVLRHSRGG